MPSEKPFGYDVTVTYLLRYVQTTETYHFRGCSEATAKRKAYRKAIMKSHVTNCVVGAAKPWTEEAWIRAYGIGRM